LIIPDPLLVGFLVFFSVVLLPIGAPKLKSLLTTFMACRTRLNLFNLTHHATYLEPEQSNPFISSRRNLTKTK
jgi:hypothetical protein